MLKFCVLASEGIRNYKVVCEYICSGRDREVRGLKYLSGSQSFFKLLSCNQT